MDGFTPPHLRVKALQPRRRRAGLEFTSAPIDLTVELLGSGFAAIIALAAICADPLLQVTVVEGDEERPITDEERDQLTAFLEAEGARVDPDNPPTDDAAESKLQHPDGAEAKAEGAAVPEAAAEAKAAEVKDAAAVDPAGTGSAPAAEPAQSGEAADATATDRKAAADEQKQPEQTPRAPVAGSNTKPKAEPKPKAKPKPKAPKA